MIKLHCLAAVLMGCLALSAAEYGYKTVYECNFRPSQLEGWRFDKRASAVPGKGDGPGMIKVEVPPGPEVGTQNFVRREIDLSPYQGKNLIFTVETKAEKVSKPLQAWNGIKFMLNYEINGKMSWFHPMNLWNSFDWKEIEFGCRIAPNAGKGTLSLGLQDSSGTVWFRNLKIREVDTSKIYNNPPVPAGFRAEYTDRVTAMPTLRGVMSPGSYRKGDLDDLAKWGANLIRWQLVRNWGKLDSDLDQTEYNRWIDSKISELEKVLADAERLGIKVVIDLHSPPGGRMANRNMRMFVEDKYADQFVEVWRKIATKFKGHPAIWAYDLVNEPVQSTPAKNDYLSLQIRAAKAIREIDPEVPVIIESNEWDAPDTYRHLGPVPMKNIIYQVHMYQPGGFTHQLVNNNWGERSDAVKLIQYPGKIGDRVWNRAALEEVLQPVIDFQKKYGVRVYVGEFSAIRWAPGADKYLEDCIAIFEKHGWDWSYHAFREWSGWSVEHSDDPLVTGRVKEDTNRKKVLLKAFERNEKVK